LNLYKGTQTIKVDAESFYALDEGDVYEIYESGGGGYGNPLRRPVDKVQADVRDGVVSVANARSDYGVVIDERTLKVDAAATKSLRA
jgi:N-methylhydantoinase B